MSHVYGTSIVHNVVAFAGKDPVAIHSLVSARLYEEVPSEAEQQDDTGSLGGFVGAMKTAWTTSDAEAKVYTVTFDPISDPEPESQLLYDLWYPVVNVRLQAGQQIQHLYKPIVVWRPIPQFSQLDVSVDDIYDIEGEIADAAGDTDTLRKIGRARTRVLKRIESKGLDRTRLQEIDLSEAVIYLAAAMSLSDMATDENNYGEKAKELREEYEAIWDGLKPGYDTDDDGDIEPEEIGTTFTPVFLMR